MNASPSAAALLAAICLVSAGCTGDGSGRNLPPAEPASVPASTPNSSSGAGTAPAREQDQDKRRGNTPPGMDRSGGGPADGAIRDPGGAVMPPTR
jgi:hypothetical protein